MKEQTDGLFGDAKTAHKNTAETGVSMKRRTDKMTVV